MTLLGQKNWDPWLRSLPTTLFRNRARASRKISVSQSSRRRRRMLCKVLPVHLPEPVNEFTARISIGGMSCASCANSITAEVQQLDFVKEVNVNLLNNSASLTYVGPKENIDKIVEQIDDIGFEASLDEVSPISRAPASPVSSAKFVSEIAITGMTCGSCVGGVTRGLEELPFIHDVSVNLLSHSGRVEFEGRDNINNYFRRLKT